MKKAFWGVLFVSAIAALMTGCEKAPTPDDMFSLCDKGLGMSETDVIDTYDIDGDGWTQQQTDQGTVYQKSEDIQLAGLPAEMQLVFMDGTLSQITLTASGDDLSQQEMGTAARQLYDDCVEVFGEPEPSSPDYPEITFDWSVYGDGEQLIENMPYLENYEANVLWSFWKGISEDFPESIVQIAARCKPSDEWTGEAFLGILIESDISDDPTLREVADDLLA